MTKTDLTGTARQFLAPERTGGVLTLEDEHRAQYLVDLVVEPVLVVGGSEILASAFQRSGIGPNRIDDFKALDPKGEKPGTLLVENAVEPDADDINVLAEFAAAGVPVILSSRRPAGGERSAAELLLAQSPGAGTIVRHSIANASVFYRDDEFRTEVAATVLGTTPPREVASYDIAVLGLDPDSSTVTQVGVAVVDRVMLEELINTNASLHRENVRLAAKRLGVHDAAAGRAAAANTEAARLRKELAYANSELGHALESARVNDELFQEARQLFFQAQEKATQLEVTVAHQTIRPKLVVKTLLARVRNAISPRN